MTAPGDCVSVYWLELHTPGFIDQLKGITTKECYCAGTIFTDHYIYISYMQSHKSLTYYENVQDKRSFETYINFLIIKIRH